MKILVAWLLGAAGFGFSAQALVFTVPGSTADYAVAEGNPPTVLSANGTSLRTGANNNATPGGRNTVLVFALPVLAANDAVVSARLAFTVVGKAGAPTFNGDLWGIGFQYSTNPILEYFEADDGDSGNVKLDDNLLVPQTAANTVVNSTNTTGLAAYLQSFYATNAGYAGGAYVFLRLTPDADAGAGSLGWSVSSAEGTAPPVLTLNTAIPASRAHTNFIIMVTDDQRWDAVGVVLREQGAAARFPWFADQTPNMDRLAAEGIRFRNAFVTYPLCSPSRAVMLSGRYNHFNGIIDNFTPFAATNLTFATQLRAAGYTTAWFGKFHMGSQNTRPGFDRFASYVAHGTYNDATFLVDGISTPTTGWVDDVATDYALSFMDAHQDRPFAMVLGFKTPHAPRTPAARHQTLYSNEVARAVPNLAHLAPYRSSPTTPAAEDVRNYFRCLKGVDENVGRVLDRLDLLGLATNTFVLYCSDNGFYLGEHGLGDKRSMYDESMRIPLLVRFPPLITQPQVRDEIVLNLDFAPTLLDLAGVPIPALMQGASWRPLLSGQPAPHWRQSFFCEYFLEFAGTTNVPTVHALRTTNSKLIIYPGHEPWTELFDLAQDIYETTNVFTHPNYLSERDTMLKSFQEFASATGLRGQLGAPRFNGAQLEMTLRGGLGPRHQIESSTNLQDWVPLLEVKMDGNETVISNATQNAAVRYYRARMMAD